MTGAFAADALGCRAACAVLAIGFELVPAWRTSRVTEDAGVGDHHRIGPPLGAFGIQADVCEQLAERIAAVWCHARRRGRARHGPDHCGVTGVHDLEEHAGGMRHLRNEEQILALVYGEGELLGGREGQRVQVVSFDPGTSTEGVGRVVVCDDTGERKHWHLGLHWRVCADEAGEVRRSRTTTIQRGSCATMTPGHVGR